MLFEKLGYSWSRSEIPSGISFSVERAIFRYRQMLAQYVYDASYLEGNPFTFPQVKTLLDGVTVGGHKVSDEQQVLNLAAASNDLFAMIRDGEFNMEKTTFDRLHAHVAREEALEWGHFRGEGPETCFTPNVSLGHRKPYAPLRTIEGAPDLKKVFGEGIQALEADISDTRERGMAFFLFGALQQFYFDGNKRTSRFMMNGILMSKGVDAISIPAVRAQEFNEKMVRFYIDRDATEMMKFIIDCQ